MTSAKLGSFSSLLREIARADDLPARRSDADDRIGQALGPYLVEARLGQGGMGVVYVAIDTRVSRRVALKVLLPKLAGAEHSRRLLLREAKAAAAINHPNVASVYELGEHEGVAYLAMELISGARLRDQIPPGGMRFPYALAVARAIAEGLAAAHRLGIVHRDLKPENIMVTREGAVKLLDFGLAKPLGERDEARDPPVAAGAAVTAPMVGTRRYLSPEQAAGGSVDTRADVFSFGVVLHELLTGRLPEAQWGGGNQLPGTVPPALAGVVRRCLATLPWERYADASELAWALRGCEPRPREHLFGRLPRATVVVLVGLAALLAMSVLGGGLVLRGCLGSKPAKSAGARPARGLPGGTSPIAVASPPAEAPKGPDDHACERRQDCCAALSRDPALFRAARACSGRSRGDVAVGGVQSEGGEALCRSDLLEIERDVSAFARSAAGAGQTLPLACARSAP